MVETDFLDVRLNLETLQYRPYRKPGDIPKYINVMSNHPPNCIKQVPKTVEKRISNLSSTQAIFNEEIYIYQKELDDNGHKVKLTYNPDPVKEKKSRRRNITWFNPPYNLDVKTNIAAKFLSMIRRHFPKEHALHKIFNRNTLKVSYSTTRNITKHIVKHNNTVKKKSNPESVTKPCNYRIPEDCPLNGDCQVGPVIYQAEVKTENSIKTYIGSTGGTFKTRYNNHKYTLNNRNANSTALSSYVWSEKDAGKSYEINWKIIARAGVYAAGSKFCDVCLTEKTHIMLADPKKSLNVRSEILNKCRHMTKCTLGKI